MPLQWSLVIWKIYVHFLSNSFVRSLKKHDAHSLCAISTYQGLVTLARLVRVGSNAPVQTRCKALLGLPSHHRSCVSQTKAITVVDDSDAMEEDTLRFEELQTRLSNIEQYLERVEDLVEGLEARKCV